MSDGRGGFREGSGRKPSGKKKFQFWITEQENEYLRIRLAEYRGAEPLLENCPKCGKKLELKYFPKPSNAIAQFCEDCKYIKDVIQNG